MKRQRKKRQQKISSLSQWLGRLKAQLKVEPLIEESCRALLELTDADRCSIMVFDAVRETLTVRWAQGVKVKPFGAAKFRVGEGLCGWVARSQKPLCSFDVQKETRFVPSASRSRPFQPVKSYCCLPLVTHGQTVGVMNLSSFKASPSFARRVQSRLRKEFLESLAQVILQASLLHEAQATAEHWRRMLKTTSETVAQVSHEVRTPLAMILEGIQQLIDGLHGALAPKQKETLSMVHGQADRMLKLVAELLDLSRIESGRLALQRVAMDWAALLEEVLGQYKGLIHPRRITFKTDSVPPVYGDRLRLTQVAENLLTNAVKFTPPTGAITLTLAARGRSAELAVTDTGIGISKTEQRRLFEKFFQPKVPATLNVRGTGLGLAIVKELVQLHGGTVRVSSDPGKGATFIVSLPLYTPAFALTEEFRVMREQAAREGQILICQTIESDDPKRLGKPEVIRTLQANLSRGDRVLLNPSGMGLVILSVGAVEGLKVIRNRLTQLIPERSIRWGWVLIPEDETELAAALQKAHERAQTGDTINLLCPQETRKSS